VTLAYDGGEFQGWQVQPGVRTVQGEVERAFSKLAGGAEVRIHGSGRTDTGVHARGQVFHVDPPRAYTAEKWREALNGILPENVRVMRVREVSPEFHARYDARGKQYRYFIHNAPVVPPDLRGVRLGVRSPLDVAAMREGASALIGTHDFKSFSANRGGGEESTVRTLRRLEWIQEDETLCLLAEADGFLYRMVRQLAGALLRTGLGQLSPSDLRRLLRNPVRGNEAPTAPARGLFLWKVFYDEPSLN